MDPEFNKARTMMQGIAMLAVTPIGLLGLLAFAIEGDMGMTLMFGTVTPFAMPLGAWLIWKSRRM